MTRSGVISLWVRRVAATVAFVLLLGLASVAQDIEVLTTSGCGCCIGWARHMEENGFAAELKNLPMADLMQVKIGAGLKPGQTSCHTGRIEGVRDRGPCSRAGGEAPSGGTAGRDWADGPGHALRVTGHRRGGAGRRSL